MTRGLMSDRRCHLRYAHEGDCDFVGLQKTYRGQPWDSTGDCVRCHAHKPGVKLFLLTSNPSYHFSAEPSKQAMPDVTNYIVCKECLTDEEAAKLLAPIAGFVIDTLYIRQQLLSPDARRVYAALLLLTGVERPNDGRKKALEALGDLYERW